VQLRARQGHRVTEADGADRISRTVPLAEVLGPTGATVGQASARLPTAARSGRRLGAPALGALGVALAGAVALALAVAFDPPRRSSGEDVYTIPPGTADRVARGLPVDDVLPSRIETRVGRALVVHNDDTTDHVFGPMVLAPGQRWERRFAVPGDYALTCTLYPETGFTIGVTPGPSPNGPATVVHGALTLGWLTATALVAGWLAVAVAAPDGVAAGLRRRARAGLPLLVGLAAIAALGGVVAMSRVVPWASAWNGPQSVGAWFNVGWVLVAALLAWRLLRPSPPGPRPATRPSGDYVVLALVALLWPAAQAGAQPGSGPIGLVLALAGAGVLAALLVEALRPAVRSGGGAVAGAADGRVDETSTRDATGASDVDERVDEVAPPGGSSAARWDASAPWLLAAAAALVLANLPVLAVPARVATGVLGAALAAARLAQGWRRPPWPPARRMVVALAVLAALSGGLRLAMEAGRLVAG